MSELQQPAPSSQQSLADRLYPSTAAPAPKPVQQQATPAQQPQRPAATAPGDPAARLYPAEQPRAAETLPPDVAKLRADPARRMFQDEKSYASTGLDKLFEGQANARDETAAWSGILGDFSASADEATTMVGLVNTIRAAPASDEVVEGWNRESRKALAERYGDRADERLAAAQQLVARDPRVSEFLLASGLASHPRVVAMVVEKAASLRAAGRLK